MIRIICRNITYLFASGGLPFVDKILLKLTKRYKEGKVKLWGKEFYYTDSSSLVGMYEEIFIEKIYNLKAYSGNGNGLIYDLGANIGLASIYLAKRHPNCEIHAYEADPDIFKILEKNVNNQGLRNIKVFNSAVWIEDAELYFEQEGSLSGKVSNADKGIKVPATSILNLLNPPVHFLKMDVEGVEVQLLETARQALKNVDYLFVEYHSSVNSKQQLHFLLELLSKNQFRYSIQEARNHGNLFIEKKLEGDFDLQLNIKAIKD